eukprot:CAMPEP_0196578934 /NCGR_PEP_ID=MMETSP1081-20130531/13584_1 /TAXON_ID=36882 /ORGANISM="Pyramimonas amylifera, Strain CCMP720" /LENGTH=167 /DNA_ID=CAMNT_0041898335 /DNA_START=386 /DNA_END=890 /DNA_ORIENTATION=-
MGRGRYDLRGLAAQLWVILLLEFAIQLHRDLKPQLDARGCKLLVVSIGTAARAKDFVEETKFPAELLLADPENVTYDALEFYKGAARTFFNPATPFYIMDRLEKDSAADLREVMPRWKPWIPPKLEQGLQQGGVFVFKGKEAFLEHYDESTGAHIALEDIVLSIDSA